MHSEFLHHRNYVPVRNVIHGEKTLSTAVQTSGVPEIWDFLKVLVGIKRTTVYLSYCQLVKWLRKCGSCSEKKISKKSPFRYTLGKPYNREILQEGKYESIRLCSPFCWQTLKLEKNVLRARLLLQKRDKK